MTDLIQENATTPAAAASTAAKNLPEDSIDFNLLRLDSTSINTTATPSYYHTPCSACGCSCSSSSPPPPIIQASSTNNNSNKRRSPTSPPFLGAPSSQEDHHHQTHKKPKKLFLDNPQELRDFTKITLPSPLGFAPPSNPSTPPLRRCHSDPPLFHGLESLSGSSTNPLSPPEGVNNGAATNTTAAANTSPASKSTTAASLPPRPPLPLRRTVSDPSPNSKSSGSSDSLPNYEMFKRMKDCIKEMNQWWDTIMPDRATGAEHETDKGTEDTNATKADLVSESDESVSVERIGEGMIINFKCPCRKGYKILLSGTDCYYKLM